MKTLYAFFFFTPRGLQCCYVFLFIEKIPSSSNKTPTSAAVLLITLASAWLAIASGVSLLSSSGDLKASLQQLLPGFVATGKQLGQIKNIYIYLGDPVALQG